MGGKNAKKMDGSEGFRWEEVGDDESVGLVLVVAFQVTQALFRTAARFHLLVFVY
jgi:hypothetical protein